MNSEKLKKLMMGMDREKLKKYVGKDLLEQLIEWKDDSLFGRDILSEIILSAYGLNTMLKKQEFLFDLLDQLKEEELQQFSSYLKSDADLNERKSYINSIMRVLDKDKSAIDLFLDLLDVNKEAFYENDVIEEPAITTLESFDRFFELLDYQYIIEQKALTRLNSNHDLVRLLIHMPTGTGKTKTAMHIITNYYNNVLNKKGLILWVAHSKELLDQAYETFCNVWKHLGNGAINIYRSYGDYKIEIDDDMNGILICGLQMLWSIRKRNEVMYNRIKKNVKLIVFDEAHKASADDTKIVINDLMNRKGGLEDRALIGLTATPGRSDENVVENKKLSAMFDGCMLRIDPKTVNEVRYLKNESLNMNEYKNIIEYLQDREVLAKIEKEELEYKNDITKEDLEKIKDISKKNDYGDFSDKVLEIFAKNKNRNIAILRRLQELDRDKIPTIVFACSLLHAKMLSALLWEAKINNVCVYGDMPYSDRVNAIKKFKNREDDCNIIINYEVLTTGFDSTNIECVFITRPTRSIVLYSQMLGRGLRGPMMGGNKFCKLIDMKDNLERYDEKMAFTYFNSYWGGNK